MPDPQPRYTKLEIGEQLRLLAKHSDEPNKGSLLKIAAAYERESDLVSGSRRALVESRSLLAKIEKLLH